MSRYAQPMSQTLAEMKMNDPKLLKVFNKLKPKATVKIKHSSTLEKGKDFIEYIVKSKNTLRNGVEKITLARKDSPTSVKRFLYNRDGKVTFAVGDMAASIDDIKEGLDEGYESEVLKVLDDAGIDGYFRNGKLYVDRRDAKAAKDALEDADNIMKLPKMVKEEVEDLDEMDMKYVLINMQGKVQGYASDKKDAMDIAKRTKSTMHPIKKKISDKTLEKMNALAKTPKELKDLGIIEAIDPADIDDLATDADKKAADKNMIMQMRKALDVKGNMKIEFGDGKKEKVDPKILDMMTKAHMKIQKPRDKEKFVAMISKSKRDMLNVAKKLSTLKMDLDKEDEPIVKKVVQMLKKASKAHAGQADDLDKAIKEALELDERDKKNRYVRPMDRKFSDTQKSNIQINQEVQGLYDRIMGKTGIKYKREYMRGVPGRKNKQTHAIVVNKKDKNAANKAVKNYNFSPIEKEVFVRKGHFVVVAVDNLDDRDSWYDKGMQSLKQEYIPEGTWKMPDNPKEVAALKKLMSRPLPIGNTEDEKMYKDSASSKLYSLLGDDELFDDLAALENKGKEKADARPVIIKWFQQRAKNNRYDLGDETKELGKQIGLKMEYVPEAYKPVKANHYDVKIQGVKKKDVNAILKYIKVDGGNYDIEDVDADQVTGGGMSSTSDGDIFIQGDDAGKLGMEIAKKFRGVKVMGEGLDEALKGFKVEFGKGNTAGMAVYKDKKDAEAYAKRAPKPVKITQVTVKNANMFDDPQPTRKEEVELDEKYDLYHKTFSDAMQHAYDYAKKKLGITVDPKEIDNKVATGPKKPSEGKTNKYRLKGKGGNLQIQVYNKGGSKPFELNMYKEENEMSDKLTGGNISLKETVLKVWQEAAKDKDEGFASDAQRKAAFASGYKEKGKKKDKEEGNEFSGELDKARKAGKKTFKVGGKEYPVKPAKKESVERYHETKQGSLRDAVLQMWGEGVKEDKKTLTKEKKNGIKKMTDTGKEVTPVETSVKMPKIKETNNKV